MDKGFIYLIRFVIFNLSLILFLSSCETKIPRRIECTYKNRSTDKYFFGMGDNHDRALRAALKSCQMDHAPWNCIFRACNEIE
jgi:hypothetical protein